jgi:hypothetical protein
MNGNNPYVTYYDDPYEFDYTTHEQQQQGRDPHSFTIDRYGYEGLPPDILNALLNTLGGHAGMRFDIHKGGKSWGGEDMFTSHWGDEQDTHYMVDASDAELVWDPNSGDFRIAHQEGGDWDYGDVWEASDYGFDEDVGALQFMDIFDPESLAAGLSAMTGVDKAIRAGEVRPLTTEMIEKTTSKYYDPYEEAGREELIEEKGRALGRAKTGGFAGSAGRQSGLSGVERLYGTGYQDLIEDILKMRGAATGDVMDKIYGWQELVSGAESDMSDWEF